MKLKSFSIIGIGGQFRIVAVTNSGVTLRRRFNDISHCFKWLKGLETRKFFLEV